MLSTSNGRTAIARALTINPSLLLADEPTGNLDSATSQEIMRIFRELNASGRTLVTITHDASVAAEARRKISIRDGQIDADTAGEGRV